MVTLPLTRGSTMKFLPVISEMVLMTALMLASLRFSVTDLAAAGATTTSGSSIATVWSRDRSEPNQRRDARPAPPLRRRRGLLDLFAWGGGGMFVSLSPAVLARGAAVRPIL